LVVDTLSRHTNYYVFIKVVGSNCPTIKGPFAVGGIFAVDFTIAPLCTGNELSISLEDLSYDPNPDLTIADDPFLTVNTKSGVFVERINILRSGQNVILNFDDHVFLRSPGEYVLQMSQRQTNAECFIVRSRQVPFEVYRSLYAEISGIVASPPDVFSGSLTIENIDGGAPNYRTFLRLDSAFTPNLDFELGPDTVEANLNLQYEIEYKNILPPGRYIVTVEDAYQCTIELTTRIPLDTEITIPNVFTPNQDGKNDVFFIRNLPIEKSPKLIISNRWGASVYSSDNYLNNWGGDGVNDGIYFYRLQILGSAPITGWVEIIRGEKP
jgi:gliding motility-associated-like protein